MYIDWASAILIKDNKPGFQTVLPAIHHAKGDTWINFDDVSLKCTIEEYLANDTYPLPTMDDREGYYGNKHFDFWLSGLKDYLIITDNISQYGNPLSANSGVLELGCASGRVLRHFLCQEKSGLNLWGADINERHINWILRYLPQSVKAITSSTLPHLPIEDNTMSLVYAISVFTHIHTLELQWLAELRRILKPGGIAYLSIISENCWNTLSENHNLYKQIWGVREHIEEYKITHEFLSSPLPEEKVALTWRTVNAYNGVVIHTTDYIRRVWGRFFEVLDIKPQAHVYHDAVILRKC